jgi:hypothetical protein
VQPQVDTGMRHAERGKQVRQQPIAGGGGGAILTRVVNANST